MTITFAFKAPIPGRSAVPARALPGNSRDIGRQWIVASVNHRDVGTQELAPWTALLPAASATRSLSVLGASSSIIRRSHRTTIKTFVKKLLHSENHASIVRDLRHTCRDSNRKPNSMTRLFHNANLPATSHRDDGLPCAYEMREGKRYTTS